MSRIPKHATCVFQGEIFSVWQWPQEMYDGSVETFEMVKRPDSVQVLAMDGEDILYTLQTQPDGPSAFLSLFGGRVDPGEGPLDAARRELKEESGMVAQEWELLWTEDRSGKVDAKIYTFMAKGCQKIAEPTLDAGERIETQREQLEDFLSETVFRQDFRDWNIRSHIMKTTPDKGCLEELKRKLIG